MRRARNSEKFALHKRQGADCERAAPRRRIDLFYCSFLNNTITHYDIQKLTTGLHTRGAASGHRYHRRIGRIAYARDSECEGSRSQMNCTATIGSLHSRWLSMRRLTKSFQRQGSSTPIIRSRLDCCPSWTKAQCSNALEFDEPAFTGSFREKIPNPKLVRHFAVAIPIFLCPSDPTKRTTKVTTSQGDFTYGGINYMVSFGSGRNTNYDFRWETMDYSMNLKLPHSVAQPMACHTVMFAETVRSAGWDQTFPTGSLPRFPYTMTLNGSSGISSNLNNIPGMRSSGSPWGAYQDANGMVANADINTFWRTFNSWRGGMSPALRGRGTSWAFSGAINSMINGYLTPTAKSQML